MRTLSPHKTRKTSYTHTHTLMQRQLGRKRWLCIAVRFVRLTGANLAAWPCFLPRCPWLANEKRTRWMMKQAPQEPQSFRGTVVTQTAGIQVICSPRHGEWFSIKASVIIIIRAAEAERWHLHNVSRLQSFSTLTRLSSSASYRHLSRKYLYLYIIRTRSEKHVRDVSQL